MRCKIKKMGRQEARGIKWGDEMRDRKKMGRRDKRQKKWGVETQDKKMGG